MREEPLSATAAAAAVPRNILLLAGGMAALYGMVELAVAAAALSFEEVGGAESLAGGAPAIFIAAAGLAAFPAGSAMDRRGRVPVLMAGFAVGIVGAGSAALGTFTESVPAVLFGLVLLGATTGVVVLSRTAAADMYPPEGRPRGIALVLFGAVFGALLGPAVFIPLLAAGDDGSSLGFGWLGAGGFLLVGLILVSRVRPDPQRIARALGHEPPAADASPAAPLAEVVRRPRVLLALVVALASWAPMVVMMTLLGSAMVDHGHSESAVFPVIAAHFVGMFGLFPLVGRLIERFGTNTAMLGGLVILAASSASLVGAIESAPLAGLALFGVGLGWNLGFVASTAELSEATQPAERGMLLGFSDLLSDLASAAFTVAGGAALATAGFTVVGVGAAAMAAVAALWVLATRGAAVPQSS